MNTEKFAPEARTLSQMLAGHRSRLPLIVPELDRIPAAILVADDAGVYVGANLLACQLTAYSRAELLKHCVEDLTAAQDAPVQERLWSAFRRSASQHGRYTLKRKDGSLVDVEYCAYANIAPGLHISFLTAL